MSLVGLVGGCWTRGWFVAKRWQIRCWTQQRSYRKVPMGFRLASSNLTLDDPEGSKVNVKILWFEISRKRRQIRGWTPREHLYVGPTGFRLAPSNLTFEYLEGSKIKLILLTWNYEELQELRHWIQRRLYRMSMGFTLDDLESLNVKVTILWFDITWKRWQIRGWTPAIGLSITTVRFDLGWPWGVKNQGHTFWREICQERQSYDVGPTGFTLNDFEKLKVKITILWFEISWKRWQIQGWTLGGLFWKQHGLSISTVRFELGWPWGVRNQIHSFLCKLCVTTVRFTMLDTMNMTLGHIDSSSMDLSPKIVCLLVSIDWIEHAKFLHWIFTNNKSNFVQLFISSTNFLNFQWRMSATYSTLSI